MHHPIWLLPRCRRSWSRNSTNWPGRGNARRLAGVAKLYLLKLTVPSRTSATPFSSYRRAMSDLIGVEDEGHRGRREELYSAAVELPVTTSSGWRSVSGTRC